MMCSIPTYQLNVCTMFLCNLPAYRISFKLGWLECSHLLMDAVISLGSWKFQSHLDSSGRIIHLEQHPLCLQKQSVSLMHYPGSEWERLKIDIQ